MNSCFSLNNVGGDCTHIIGPSLGRACRGQDIWHQFCCGEISVFIFPARQKLSDRISLKETSFKFSCTFPLYFHMDSRWRFPNILFRSWREKIRKLSGATDLDIWDLPYSPTRKFQDNVLIALKAAESSLIVIFELLFYMITIYMCTFVCFRGSGNLI